MSICWLLKKNDTGLRLSSAICDEGLQIPLASLAAAPLLDLGPVGRFTGYRTLAKEEVPRKRSLGLSCSKRPDMNYTTQGRDVSSLTLIPNEMIIVQDTYKSDHAFTMSVTGALLGCPLRGHSIHVVNHLCCAVLTLVTFL